MNTKTTPPDQASALRAMATEEVEAVPAQNRAEVAERIDVQLIAGKHFDTVNDGLRGYWRTAWVVEACTVEIDPDEIDFIPTALTGTTEGCPWKAALNLSMSMADALVYEVEERDK